MKQRLTDDNGRSTRKPEDARCVTSDGRLLWIGPLLPHQHGEFFLDGVNLGNITLEQAMGSYKSSGTGAPVKEDRFNDVAHQRPTTYQKKRTRALYEHEFNQRLKYERPYK